jgi:hypothetical protein
MRPILRPKLLWLGRPAQDQDRIEAKNRGLALEEVGEGQPDFKYARAAVFWASDADFFSALEALERHVAAAIDEGLLVFVVISDDSAQLAALHAALQKTVPAQARNRNVTIRTEPVPAHEAPNAALLHEPGPVANEGVKIQGDKDGLSEAQLLLLRRAFHDCTSIKLTTIKPGFSGARTFIVDATLLDSESPPEPMPFFVKVGESGKLLDELERFCKYAEHHITWTLRPNFVRDRSIFGVAQGILVGTFVADSVSLAECARKGRGVQYITTLFEETLAGFRRGAKESEGAGSVVAALVNFDRHGHIPDERVKAAQEAFGGTMCNQETLWRKLVSAPRRQWRKCVMHGDMHGDNVRVRKADAIVIDFAQAQKDGPACADLASLEVWLAFELDGDQNAAKHWQGSMEVLYGPENIERALRGEVLDGPGWVHPCLAEIRRLATKCILSSEEYKRVLAVYLLRHASFPAADGELRQQDERRRQYAYWLANRLVASLSAIEVAKHTEPA